MFEKGKDRKTAALKRKVTKLEEKLFTKNDVLGELMEDHIKLKKSWGDLSEKWATQKMRDQVVGFVQKWTSKDMITQGQIVTE